MVAKTFHPFDSRLEHRAAGSAALTSTTTLDTITQKAATRTKFITKCYVESIDVANGDETYTLSVECSDDNFTTINEVAAVRVMGDATQLTEAGDTVAGDEYELEWSTEISGVTYRYWRVRLIVAGTSPSMGIHCYSTRVGV